MFLKLRRVQTVDSKGTQLVTTTWVNMDKVATMLKPSGGGALLHESLPGERSNVMMVEEDPEQIDRQMVAYEQDMLNELDERADDANCKK